MIIACYVHAFCNSNLVCIIASPLRFERLAYDGGQYDIIITTIVIVVLVDATGLQRSAEKIACTGSQTVISHQL